MKVTELGLENKKKMLLLPGTACCWEINFGNVINEMQKKYHLICINYDGFDGDEKTEFSNMLDATRKIEDYIIKHHDERVDGAYGSSLGGSFVGLLIQRKRIHIDHGFIGSAKYEKRYRRHFANVDLRKLDMQHEAWMFDSKWAQPVMNEINVGMEG